MDLGSVVNRHVLDQGTAIPMISPSEMELRRKALRRTRDVMEYDEVATRALHVAIRLPVTPMSAKAVFMAKGLVLASRSQYNPMQSIKAIELCWERISKDRVRIMSEQKRSMTQLEEIRMKEIIKNINTQHAAMVRDQRAWLIAHYTALKLPKIIGHFILQNEDGEYRLNPRWETDPDLMTFNEFVVTNTTWINFAWLCETIWCSDRHKRQQSWVRKMASLTHCTSAIRKNFALAWLDSQKCRVINCPNELKLSHMVEISCHEYRHILYMKQQIIEWACEL